MQSESLLWWDFRYDHHRRRFKAAATSSSAGPRCRSIKRQLRARPSTVAFGSTFILTLISHYYATPATSTAPVISEIPQLPPPWWAHCRGTQSSIPNQEVLQGVWDRVHHLPCDSQSHAHHRPHGEWRPRKFRFAKKKTDEAVLTLVRLL